MAAAVDLVDAVVVKAVAYAEMVEAEGMDRATVVVVATVAEMVMVVEVLVVAALVEAEMVQVQMVTVEAAVTEPVMVMELMVAH